MLFLRNLMKPGGSKLMNMDASVTPAAFSYSPTPGINVKVKAVTCVMVNPGSSVLGSFKNSLLKGIQLSSFTGGKTNVLKLIKDKADLLTCFCSDVSLSSTSDIFMGTFVLTDEITIGSNDSFYALVQDNLSNIEHLSMSIVTSR